MEPNEKISSEAVKSTTGKNWQEWFDLLDVAGAKDMSHKEMVGFLFDNNLMQNGWWCQMITNTYEKHIGRRTLGQMETGFQVGSQKTFPINLEQAWKLITSPESRKLWLDNIEDFDWAKGQNYLANNGITGEIRVYTHGVNIRLSWKKPGWQKHSTVQVRLIPKGEKSTISIHHEGLPSKEDREAMKQHWMTVMDKLLFHCQLPG